MPVDIKLRRLQKLLKSQKLRHQHIFLLYLKKIRARRGRPISFDLPSIDNVGSALTAMASVIDGVAKGQLTPEEGKAVSGLIETYRRIMETAELERRIAALEGSSIA